jgi:hypothetical protein
MRFAIARFAFLSVATTSLASAQSVLQSYFGPSSSRVGAALDAPGDLNGDGYQDVLAGRPGGDGGRGQLVCVSGRYLAGQGGLILLWTYSPGAALASADASFGNAVTSIADLDGDGIRDFVVGAPFDDAGGTNAGAVFFLKGSATAPTLLRKINGEAVGDWFGWALDGASDLTFDGKEDVAVGAPLRDDNGANVGAIYKVSGNAAITGGAWKLGEVKGLFTGEQLGRSVLAGINLNGDFYRDIVAGAPFAAFLNETSRGAVRVYDGFDLSIEGSYYGSIGDEWGTALGGGADWNSDGRPDVLIGAPGSALGGSDSGRVVLLSGAEMFGQNSLSVVIAEWNGGGANRRFGTSVASTLDISGDGTPDLLVGAPGYEPLLFGQNNGGVYVFSGASFERIGFLQGEADELLGDRLAPAFAVGGGGDLNGDGVRDFFAAGSSCDSVATNGGVVKGISLFPSSPVTYCTGKTNSLGCIPGVTRSGLPSVSSATPFSINAVNIINQKQGLLFYGFAPESSPFQGGTLCVAAPTTRTAVQSSGGSTSGADCTGTFALDFNTRIQSGVDPALSLGAEVYCQYWSRDPQSPSTTSLTNALRFLVQP